MSNGMFFVSSNSACIKKCLEIGFDEKYKDFALVVITRQFYSKSEEELRSSVVLSMVEAIELRNFLNEVLPK